ncbi:hypothetical protein LTR86_007057 [Recurvomyces mirabilis]|nr:hypothetical protein LTR86_007057 [Recurvomyces mirabilis]
MAIYKEKSGSMVIPGDIRYLEVAIRVAKYWRTGTFFCRLRLEPEKTYLTTGPKLENGDDGG